MVKSHYDYIVRKTDADIELIRDFDGMYVDIEDPHGQSIFAFNFSHKIYISIIRDFFQSLVFGRKFFKPIEYIDLGCGLGHFTNRIQQLYSDKINAKSVDISETAIRKASSLCDGIKFQKGSISDKKFMASLGTFDMITCFEILYYFKEDEIKTVIANISSIIIPRGHIIISYHLPDKMDYGKYNQNLSDLHNLFNEFETVWEMDFTDNYSLIYNNDKFGRYLLAILKKK